ncbi:hypothetical protein AALA56_08670 [Streptococcus hyointestinalis]|uniref:hypothetical protein n=1 Tax=Streptococcus hyointestinalis TaxID=1337 RepID=UPI0035199F3D
MTDKNKDPQLERNMLVIEMIVRSYSTESFLWSFLYLIAAATQIIFFLLSFILALFLMLGLILGFCLKGTPIPLEAYNCLIVYWALFTITAMLSRIVLELKR